MISIQNLSKSFEKENLYEEMSLVIHPNNRITLVGKNGSGKSTFFRCLTSQEDYKGAIQLHGTKIVMMEQENYFESLDISFTDYLDKKRTELEDKKVQIAKDLENPEIYEDEDRFSALLEEYGLLTDNDSPEIEECTIKNILAELEVDEKILCKHIVELSGGQKMKLRLAECLSKKADLYLFDEPTNNLDLETSKWLIEYIKKFIP
ncbi:MAG: ATP-binding cassette subfamily F protein 3, partial [Patescibacteria group bacterium]